MSICIFHIIGIDVFIYESVYMCVFVYTQLICLSYIVVVYFSPVEAFVTCYSFSLSDMVDKTQSQRFQFSTVKQLYVHLWLYIHTYMANTYTHTTLSLVLMQVDHEKM